MNEKLYMGFLALAEIAKETEKDERKIRSLFQHPGKIMEAYENIKPLFRYPGEMLERYKEHGFVTKGDTFSLLLALYRSMIWSEGNNGNLFVGEQLQDFLKSVKKDNEGWRSPFLSFLLYLMGEEEIESLIQNADSLTEKEFYSFILFTDYLQRRESEIPRDEQSDFLKRLLLLKPDLPQKIRLIFPVDYENLKTYLYLGTFASANHVCAKEWRNGLSEWKTLINTLSQLYGKLVKEGTSTWKLLLKYGFTKEEIMDLNCGINCYYKMHRNEEIIFYNLGTMPHTNDSYIKFCRQERDWFTARLCANDPVPEWVKNLMLQNKTGSLERKIDGTNSKSLFYFGNQVKDPSFYPCMENRYLLFELTRNIDTSKTSLHINVREGDPLYCFFDPCYKENKEFIKGITDYIKRLPENRGTGLSVDDLDQELALSCILYILDVPYKDYAYTELIQMLKKFESNFGYAYGKIIMENASILEPCEYALYEMFDHGDANIQEYCSICCKNTTSTEEAFFKMKKVYRKILKSYMCRVKSKYAYDFLVSISKYANDNGKDLFVLGGAFIDPDDLIKRMEKHDFDHIISKKDQKDLCIRTLESVFRYPAYAMDPSYEKYVAKFLCCNEIRELFQEEECLEVYRAISKTDVDPELLRKLDKIFLNEKELKRKEELDRKKDDEEKKREELRKEELERKEREENLADYTKSINDSMDAGQKLCILSKNAMYCYGNRKISVAVMLIRKYICDEKIISLAKEELEKVVGFIMHIWEENGFDYHEMVSILSKLSEIKED